MKKLFLTVVAAALMMNVASAGDGHILVGAGADVNLFIYDGTTTSYHPKSLSGFHINGAYEYSFNKYLALSGGLRLSEIGFIERKAVTYEDQSNTKSWKKAFVEVPLMFKTRIWKGSFVEVGAIGELGLLYNMKDVRKDGGSVVSTEKTNLYATIVSGEKVYSRLNLGVEGRLGYDFGRIRAYAGYKYDFFNVYSNGDDTAKMMQIQLGINVKL